MALSKNVTPEIGKIYDVIDRRKGKFRMKVTSTGDFVQGIVIGNSINGISRCWLEGDAISCRSSWASFYSIEEDK